jgi:hypothetical protein
MARVSRQMVQPIAAIFEWLKTVRLVPPALAGVSELVVSQHERVQVWLVEHPDSRMEGVLMVRQLLRVWCCPGSH